MFRKLALVLAVMVLAAGLALAATGMDRLASFELLDQNGRPSAIAVPGKTTLVYFYRGDW